MSTVFRNDLMDVGTGDVGNQEHLEVLRHQLLQLEQVEPELPATQVVQVFQVVQPWLCQTQIHRMHLALGKLLVQGMGVVSSSNPSAIQPGTPGNQTLKVFAQHVFLDLVECCPMLSVVHAIPKPSRNKNC